MVLLRAVECGQRGNLRQEYMRTVCNTCRKPGNQPSCWILHSTQDAVEYAASRSPCTTCWSTVGGQPALDSLNKGACAAASNVSTVDLSRVDHVTSSDDEHNPSQAPWSRAPSHESRVALGRSVHAFGEPVSARIATGCPSKV